MAGIFAFYNIGWQNSRLNQLRKHSQSFKRDLRAAMGFQGVDVLLLFECGEPGEGLDPPWLKTLADILKCVFLGTSASFIRATTQRL